MTITVSFRAIERAAWIALAAVLLCGALAYPRLYALCRTMDPPLVANLDTLSMIGIPAVAVLVALVALQRRRAAVPEPADPTAVYRFYAADGELLYVGISCDPEHRIRQHSRAKAWWPEVVRTETRGYRTRNEAARAEHAAITTEYPRFNVARFGLASHLRSARAQ